MDLQDALDDLAASVARPVSVEDRRWRLVAYSAHGQDGDEVRRASILARVAPADVSAWLDSLDLDRAAGVVDVPANPALAMDPRVCVPLRHGDTLLGYVWIIVGDHAPDEEERRTIAAGARRVADVLWRRRISETRERRDHDANLRTVLGDASDEARRRAAARLAEELGWAPAGPVTVLAARAADGTEPEAVAERARRRWDTHGLVWRSDGDDLLLVVQLGAREATAVEAALRTVQEAGAAVVAAGAVRTDLADLRGAAGEAQTALRIVTAVPALGPRARWEELGSWALLAGAPGAPPPTLPAPIRAVLAQRNGSELLSALEAALDSAGDMATAAASLNLSRATLYRRLRRVEELTGLRLAVGDDRLVLHLGVRLWRLAGSAL